MSEWFHVGQKVVCVRDEWNRRRGYAYPKKGDVLTVREIFTHGGTVFLRFREINNPQDRKHKTEEAFNADCFRPLRKRSTDISCFKAMLEPSKQGADA